MKLNAIWWLDLRGLDKFYNGNGKFVGIVDVVGMLILDDFGSSNTCAA